MYDQYRIQMFMARTKTRIYIYICFLRNTSNFRKYILVAIVNSSIDYKYIYLSPDNYRVYEP